MFTIVVPGVELFNEETEEFEYTEDFTLELEHSLASLSKWESIHEKPFLGKEEKTPDEVLSYVECMILSKDYPEGILQRLTEENLNTIRQRLDAKLTATWFSDRSTPKKSSVVITSELIYYWMSGFQIPFECENWPLNRLFTLLRVCSTKNSAEKKMSRAEIAAQNRELNARRRAQLKTRG